VNENDGGDATQNDDFHREKQRLQGTNVFAGAFILYSERNEQLGGDASENDDFQSEKQRLQGYNCFQELSFYVQKELMNDSFQLCIFWFKISHGESAWRYCIFSF